MVKIESEEKGSVRIISLDGRIDGQNAQETEEKLIKLVEHDKTLILELSKVPFMTSAGLRALLSFYRGASTANCKVFLVGLTDEIKDVMTITGFLGFFKVYNDLDALFTAEKLQWPQE